jgi:hypothetical protein
MPMRCVETTSEEKGLALMGAMVVALGLALLSATLLDLAWQESLSAGAGKKAAAAQQLADAAGELVIGWFHNPQTSPPAVATALSKRYRTSDGAPTFFDQSGRSQFVGSADRPDVLLDASNQPDDRLLNDPDIGVFRSKLGSGTVRLLKIYSPSRPGLLCTVETVVETESHRPFRQSISMQLEALELPALRAGLQSGQSLRLMPDGRSVGGVHWGSVKVGGDLVIRRIEDIPTLNPSAPITGQSYDESPAREDRWMDMWIGGRVQVTQPPLESATDQTIPPNVHERQSPTPGVRLDRWSYDRLKQTAMRFGSYYVLDQGGLLYRDGLLGAGRGLSPNEVFGSQPVGDQLGLIFVDTLDRTAPRADNLGTVKLSMEYLEGVAVIQGHVFFNPAGSGNRLKVLSPPTGDAGTTGVRESVQLTNVHLNGVLYAAGNITVGRAARVYGAMIAEGSLVSAGPGATLEVWHDYDMSRGLFRGVPVVYRAPGTWMVRY